MPSVVTALGKALPASLPEDELTDRFGRVRELPLFAAKSHRTFEALRRDPARDAGARSRRRPRGETPKG